MSVPQYAEYEELDLSVVRQDNAYTNLTLTGTDRSMAHASVLYDEIGRQGINPPTVSDGTSPGPRGKYNKKLYFGTVGMCCVVIAILAGCIVYLTIALQSKGW